MNVVIASPGVTDCFIDFVEEAKDTFSREPLKLFGIILT